MRNWYTPEKYQNTPNKYDPDSINDTLTQLRIISGQSNNNPSRQGRPSTSRQEESNEQREQINDARNAAERAIIEAERHKARDSTTQ